MKRIAAALFPLAAAALLLASAGSVPWAELANPVLTYPTWSVKDAAVVRGPDAWYVFFGAFYEDRGQVRSHVVEVYTKDFRTFSEPVLNLSGAEDGWKGMASPDVFRDGHQWVMTYNSWGDLEGRPNQLFYRTSRDLRQWSAERRLAPRLTAGIRAIDAAAAKAGGRYYLLYKEVQSTKLATSTALDGEFRVVGDGSPRFTLRDGRAARWHENYQFLRLDGRWMLLATGAGHLPHLYRMKGAGDKVNDWLDWRDGRALQVPLQDFNTVDRANAASLVNGGAVDGFFYLLYAGNTEKTSYLRRGWNRLALARSRDLDTWTVPPR